MGAFDFAWSNTGGTGVRYSSPGFSASYSNNAFYDFFYFQGWEEILMFALVFLIGFTFAYVGLKRFFSEDMPDGYYADKKGNRVWKKAHTVITNKPALLVLSLSVSILMVLGLTRNGWLYYYFGDIAGMFGIFLLTAVFLVLLFGVFKYIEKAFGKVAGAALCSAMLWSGIAWLVYVSESFSSLPFAVQESLTYVADPWFLAGFVIVGFIAGKVMG